MFSRNSNTPCDKCPRPSIYEDNVEAWDLFVASESQFRYMEFGPTGLDYSGVEFVMKCKGIQHSAELFERLRILESGFLKLVRDA